MVDSIPPFSGQKDAEEMQFQYRGDCLNTEGSGKKLYHHKFKALNIITNETRGSVCWACVAHLSFCFEET